METISKHIGEGFGKGELYAALAYDSGDAFGGMQIKQLRFSPDTGAIALDFKDAHAGAVIETGTYGIESKGVTLSSTNVKPVSFLFDDGGSALGAGSYRAVLSRIYLSTDIPSGTAAAIRSIRGQLTLASGVDIDISPSQWNAVNGVDGYIQILGASTFGAHTRVACVHATMQLTGAVTVTSGGRLAGFFAEMSGITAATCTNPYPVAFLVDKLDSLHVASQRTWENGLYIMGDSCVKGIYVGSCSTIGISIEGTHTLAIGIGQSTALTTATNATSVIKVNSDFSNTTDLNYHVPVWITGRYTADGDSAASIYTLRGHVEVEGTLTTASGQQYIIGVHGRAKISGAIVNGGAMVMGMKAEMLDGSGETMTVSHMAALWCDYQNKDTVTGQTDILYLTNNSDTTMNNAIFIYGHQVTNFVNFDSASSQGGMLTTGAAQDATVTCDAKIKIKIGTATLYIPAYAGTITLKAS